MLAVNVIEDNFFDCDRPYGASAEKQLMKSEKKNEVVDPMCTAENRYRNFCAVSLGQLSSLALVIARGGKVCAEITPSALFFPIRVCKRSFGW